MIQFELRRIAILNRGEAASRFLRGLADYNAERGTCIEGVAFFTTPDAGARWVRAADDAVALGDALVPGPDWRARSAYLDADRIVRLLRESRCDAVWPGWGFMSEDADFVARLESAGIVFLGPPSAAMRRLGDKLRARQLAESVGVPVTPWVELDSSMSEEQIVSIAERIGFPVMVKATSGGGGRGIRRVERQAELGEAVRAVRGEVLRQFGGGTVLVESCLTGCRHVEVQLIGEVDGRARAVGVRDCSVQRKHQKVLEETPSPVLPESSAEGLLRASERLAEAAGYRGVGTAEFLLEPKSGRLSFLEVNARLQVEHTITELTSGLDLVHAQIDIARGLPVRWPERAPGGHAIEARLCAEDPENGCAPAPGLVRLLALPGGPGVRVDAGVAEGERIGAEFDSMIAKVMAWAPTRELALARLRRALRELRISIDGGAHNRGLLLALLDSTGVVRASSDTGWMDGALSRGELRGRAHLAEAAAVAAARLHARATGDAVSRFFADVQNGIPRGLPAPEGSAVELRVGGRAVHASVRESATGVYEVDTGGQAMQVELGAGGPSCAVVHAGGERLGAVISERPAGMRVEVDATLHSIETSASGIVRSPAPALIVRIDVEVGSVVVAGQRLLTLEAMKLEMPVASPISGRVRALLCRAHQQVKAGQPLIEFEASERGDAAEAVVTGPQEHAEEAGTAAGATRTPGVGEPADARTSESARSPSDSREADASGGATSSGRRRPLEMLLQAGLLRPEALDDLDEERAREAIHDFVGAVRGMLLGFDTSGALRRVVSELARRDFDFRRSRHPQRWLPLLALLDDFVAVEGLFGREAIGEGAGAVTSEFAFYDYCRRVGLGERDAGDHVASGRVAAALARYGLSPDGEPERVREALWRMAVAHAHGDLPHRAISALVRAALRMHEARLPIPETLAHTMEQVARLATPAHPAVADNALHALLVLDLLPRGSAHMARAAGEVRRMLAEIQAARAAGPGARPVTLLRTPIEAIAHAIQDADSAAAAAGAELLVRRLYSGRGESWIEPAAASSHGVRIDFSGTPGGKTLQGRAVVAVGLPGNAPISEVIDAVRSLLPCAPERVIVEWVLCGPEPTHPDLAALHRVRDALGIPLVRLTATWGDEGALHHRTAHDPDWAGGAGRLEPELHPERERRLELDRFAAFDVERILARGDVVALRVRARENHADERLILLCEVSDPLDEGWDERPEGVPAFDLAFLEAARVLRAEQALRGPRDRLHNNRIVLYVTSSTPIRCEQVLRFARKMAPVARGLGLERVAINARMPSERRGGSRDAVFVVSSPGRHRLAVREEPPAVRPVQPLDAMGLRRMQARRMGVHCPWELIRMLEGRSAVEVAPHPDMRRGRFQEHELDSLGDRLIAIARPDGENTSGVIVGTIRHHTAKHPEGMERVLVLSDPTRAMGALGEPECRRILAAIDLADQLGVPLEWVPVSSGARIAMDSGTENLDWTARVLRRIVEFTRSGGVIHVLVAGTCVGAQSYWNSMATMLTQTRGILVMTPDAAMVLTGKRALEVSGSVAAEDERGIGGFDRVMGPNGQAQFLARDMGEAWAILFEHYRFTWCRRGDRGPRPLESRDSPTRSILDAPYRSDTGGFATVGEIFSEETNPGRKRPFAIRDVMSAVADRDGGMLERWAWMRDAETAVVQDVHIGGLPACLIGFESRPQARQGAVPMDGPDTWTGGTLFPQSSRKVARALRAASGNRPAVVLANLSGFDGSPESMRRLQLEYGAEIGRAVVEFDGPILFVVVGRYHGGAYVVFSKALNRRLEAIAVEGSYASVIGGAPAAAVVFPREVARRVQLDSRVVAARRALEEGEPGRRPRLREKLDARIAVVTLEEQARLAREFDRIHSVERAVRVGSLDAVIPAARLRPELIHRLRRAQQSLWAREAVPTRIETTGEA